MIRRIIICSFYVSLVFLTSHCAADFVTFGNANVDRLIDLGPQVEGNFSYTATVGEGWELQGMFSVEGAALVTFFNGEGALIGDSVEFVASSGSLFTFDSLQFATIASSGSDQVEVVGLRNGGVVDSALLDFSTASNTSFTTVDGFDGFIDTLQLNVVFDGFNAAIFDNIELTIVPEPSLSFALVLAGLVMTARFRRRNGQRFAYSISE